MIFDKWGLIQMINQKIDFKILQGTLENNILKQVSEIQGEIFDNPYDQKKISSRLEQSENPLSVLAFDQDKLIAFKIGYQTDLKTFYSWIGGVLPSYRKQGIAHELMTRQHQWLKEHQYQVVETKTGNEFKGMLILNIKNGFDIIETMNSSKGKLRILLRKVLS